VIVTVPLGCLKAGDVQFEPQLSIKNEAAIKALGFGDLNKVVLEFPHVFWEGSADFFGAAIPGGPEARGRCFMFWNLHRVSGRPILAALVSGAAAYVRRWC
jgi:lysine-specific histone demethylase 1